MSVAFWSMLNSRLLAGMRSALVSRAGRNAPVALARKLSDDLGAVVAAVQVDEGTRGRARRLVATHADAGEVGADDVTVEAKRGARRRPLPGVGTGGCASRPAPPS